MYIIKLAIFLELVTEDVYSEGAIRDILHFISDIVTWDFATIESLQGTEITCVY
ncbi:hypothetical protein VIBC2010_10422 [Vibrio caribbeanicus ATCC BAA-2122]|uniref:Uncharacterized protein n=1 Tax=Vibrio caribbeanicus ATCC BAA-2122 TaxID=796620 RepID=E3BFL9_9VIBR|nr:hypothetical protein VIBC2010_10422 [Vibrio caribbeanicus ATCC BAA-2122]